MDEVVTSVSRSMMPGYAVLDPDLALAIKLRMFWLRRIRCVMPAAHRQFIANMCCTDPAFLTEEQRRYVDRLAWRYRWHMPVGCRPAAEPEER